MHFSFADLLNPTFVAETFGMLGIMAFIFAESGLFFGVVLPGDSLLFVAGILAAAGHINLFVLIIGSFIAAVIGDSVGYSIGKKAGDKLFTERRSRFLKPIYIERVNRFFAKHGQASVILARFVPIVRTLTPLLAGIGQMPYKRFFSYNIIGGAIWCILIPTIGYTLGRTIPNIDSYLIPIVGALVVLSFIPTFFAARAVHRGE